MISVGQRELPRLLQAKEGLLTDLHETMTWAIQVGDERDHEPRREGQQVQVPRVSLLVVAEHGGKQAVGEQGDDNQQPQDGRGDAVLANVGPPCRDVIWSSALS